MSGLIGYKFAIHIHETEASALLRKVTNTLWTASRSIFLLLALSVPFLRTLFVSRACRYMMW